MKKIFFIVIFVTFCVVPLFSVNAESLGEKLAGRILLQVDNNGEAWYVNPVDFKKYFLSRPLDAFNIMRSFGIGITNIDLAKIPIGIDIINGNDTDNDGLSDSLENAIGTDFKKEDTDGDGFDDKKEIENNYYPLGEGKIKIDLLFSQKQNGRILLQVENNGEAWYVNPENSKRYYLGTPFDFFNIVKKLGLGITNKNINNIKTSVIENVNNEQITTSSDDNVNKSKSSSTSDIIVDTTASSTYNITELEKQIFELINNEREKEGHSRLKWNSEIANVARRHSGDLADENKLITSYESICDIPMIHHEGLKFGIYNAERLKNSGIYYFSKTGENIALMSGIEYKNVISKNKDEIEDVNNCETIRDNLNTQFKSTLEAFDQNENKVNFIKEELEKRKKVFDNMGTIKVVKDKWKEQKDLAVDVTQGWMNSPPHKRNIMDGEFNESGIGIVYVNGYIIATQSFITRIDCGYKDVNCCIEEGYYPYCYQPLSCNDNNICKE